MLHVASGLSKEIKNESYFPKTLIVALREQQKWKENSNFYLIKNVLAPVDIILFGR